MHTTTTKPASAIVWGEVLTHYFHTTPTTFKVGSVRYLEDQVLVTGTTADGGDVAVAFFADEEVEALVD